MNNEPVGVVCEFEGILVGTLFEQLPDGTPLYTHPAKELDDQFKKGFEAGKEEGWKAHKFHHSAKTLTDEEIKEVYGEYFDVENCDWLHLQCIQAILKKASEK